MRSSGAWYGGELVLAAAVVVCLMQAACSGSKGTADQEPSSRPAASRPSAERILLRIGDRAVVTQAEVEKLLYMKPPAQRGAAAYEALSIVLGNKLFLLYLQDHPDLVTDEDVEKEIQTDLKKLRHKTREELKEGLELSGVGWEEYLGLARIRSGRAKLARQGAEQAKDEAYLRKLFDEHPDYFNGATIKFRHIHFAVPVTATPEERKARLEAITKLREDLVSGRKTWEECVKQSSDNTRFKNGLVGTMPRYMRVNEAIIKPAWELQPGQTSDIVEGPMGYHIIQVLERSPGYRDFNDPHTQFELKAVTQNKPLEQAMAEVHRKYPIVGVQPLDMEAIMALPPPPTQPARTPATRPTTRPTTRRATPPATRPVPAVRPATGPAARPATRPSPARLATRPAIPQPPAVRPAVPPVPPVLPGPAPAPQPVTSPAAGTISP